jgi:hypothetical protein
MRQFSRVRFQVGATVISAEKRIQGTVENLSMHGMFLVTDQQLPINAAVEITIALSGVTPEIAITVNGKVRRIAPNGIGFDFERMDLDSYTHLKNIIAYNLSDADKVMEEIHQSIERKHSDKE